MQKGKDIRFKHSWWQSLRLFTRDIRDEVFCAICEYGMEQKEPEELSDMALGIFSQIRIDIDERAAHEEQVRETRKRTGRLGAEKTNAMRWGEDRQKSAKVGKSRQMSANADNTHSHNAHARGFETVLGWLVDDTERLKLEFYRLQLIASTDDEECARVILPYIDAYFEQNDFSADWERKGRKDTKAHFSSWVRKHKNLEENGTTTEAKPAGKQRTTARDAYNAALLGISLADAERSDPEE